MMMMKNAADEEGSLCHLEVAFYWYRYLWSSRRMLFSFTANPDEFSLETDHGHNSNHFF